MPETVVDSENEIGHRIYFDLSEGDVVDLTFESGEHATLDVYEVNSNRSGEVGSEMELLAEPVTDEQSVVYGLYAQVLFVGEIHVDFDTYVVKMPDDTASSATEHRVSKLAIK